MFITLDDDKTLADFNMAVLKGNERPLTPSIKPKTVDIPGRIGSWDFGDELGPRQVQIPIGYMGQDNHQKGKDIQDFIDYITDEWGKPRIMKVVFSDEPSLFQLLKMRVAPIAKHYTVGADFTLELTGNDPNKYARFTAEDVSWGSKDILFSFDYLMGHTGRGEIHIQSDTVSWGSQIIDFSYNFLMGDTSSGGNNPISKKFDLENKGLAVSPIVKIRGSATKVTFFVNGVRAFIVENLNKAEYELDFIRYIGFLNGKEVFVDGEFILHRGINEIIAESVNSDIYFSVSYRERYN